MEPREHFIPLRKLELVQLLSSQPGIDEASRSLMGHFCRMLEATLHHQYYAHLQRVRDTYAPFDPDDDTQPVNVSTRDEAERHIPELFEQVAFLLERANYRRLSRQDVEQAVEAVSDWGVQMHIDFDAFAELEVFARGDVISRRTRRRLRRLYRPEEIDVPLYHKLVVMFRLRSQPRLDRQVPVEAIHIKMFKNIPKQDLDMLLPATRIKMTLVDQGRILLPTISGLTVTLIKIIKTGVLLAFASVYGLLAFLGLIGGTIGYGIKSFFGYQRARDRYQLSLARSLYYQNLDNNAGVLYRLVDEAECQEFREAVLAYFLLWQYAGREGWTMQQIDREAERWLGETIGVTVDFEIDDALGKLAALSVVQPTGNGRWTAVPIDEALRRMDVAWDQCFEFGGPPHGDVA